MPFVKVQWYHTPTHSANIGNMSPNRNALKARRWLQAETRLNRCNRTAHDSPNADAQSLHPNCNRSTSSRWALVADDIQSIKQHSDNLWEHQSRCQLPIVQ